MRNPETLVELMSGLGVRPKSFRAGHTEKMVCPKCQDKHDQSLSLTIDADGDGAVMKCHRGKCGWEHGSRLQGASSGGRGAYSAPTYRRPEPYVPVATDRPDSLYEFFDLRGIGHETVDWFGCYVARKSFPDGAGWSEHDCVVFPYTLAGEVVNRKYRGFANKNLMMQEKEPKPTLFNVDSVSSMDEVIWVEGEPDVMAVHEAGYRQILSLKDGAPDKLRKEDDPARENDKRFAAFKTHADLLARIQKFILAGDKDGPGAILREELARRLGRHRCWTVDWPAGCKDAGDVLRLLGPDALRECIANARPWPIEGVQEVTGIWLDDYLERPAPPTMTTGIRSVDEVVRLPGEGRIIIVTGFPNSGKSVWTMNVMIHTMQKHGRRWLVFSPEMQPCEEFAAQCAQIYTQHPARKSRENPNLVTMTREQRRAAGDWLTTRMSFLSSDSEDKPPTIDWIIDTARDAVLRRGVTDLLIDPFNEIEQVESERETETKYIGRVLQRLRSFGLRHGCNVWIIAHPAKPSRDKNGAIQGAPGPYDISGSAHWANKADIGITIHTPDKETQFILWKARFSRWGRKNAQANMQYTVETCRYWS